MNTLPDLSQLTHEQLLEFTRQLALQHQSLAQSNQQLDARVQHLEVTNQQLDSKVQHLSILNQKYEHELALFKQHKFGSKNEHLTAKQIHLWDEAVEEDIVKILYYPYRIQKKLEIIHRLICIGFIMICSIHDKNR